jgi:hypothetical protein
MRNVVYLILAILVLSAAGCAAPLPPPTPTPQPSATPAPPTETPLPYDPEIYVELFSYEAEYGSLAAAFEDYEQRGYCTNPFREGYPRRDEAGNWLFVLRNSYEGSFILHDFMSGVDNQVVTFTLSASSGSATQLNQFPYHYRIITHRGALISFDIQGDTANCEIDAENRLIRDLIFSPSTNDFVFRKTEPGELIGFIGPVLTVGYGDVYVSEYVTGEVLCDRANPKGKDYVAYRLPGSDGEVFSWGRESLCMYLTADRVK